MTEKYECVPLTDLVATEAYLEMLLASGEEVDIVVMHQILAIISATRTGEYGLDTVFVEVDADIGDVELWLEAAEAAKAKGEGKGEDEVDIFKIVDESQLVLPELPFMESPQYKVLTFAYNGTKLRKASSQLVIHDNKTHAEKAFEFIPEENTSFLLYQTRVPGPEPDYDKPIDWAPGELRALLQIVRDVYVANAPAAIQET